MARMSWHAVPSGPPASWPTQLFGRDRELADARGLMASSRLVTLTGPGGVGKTSLAAAMAGTLERAFKDGVWFVELGAQRSSETVAEWVATGLGLSTAPVEDAEEQLRRHLTGRSALLVLDNCEHVLPGCQRLVARLLGACDELRVLTTSREPLRLRGERAVVVRPLPVPPVGGESTVGELRAFPAVALLEARAKSVNDQFEITERELPSVVELVARLDGMPLAIELAAARLRSLSIRELLDRINDRFTLLNRGDPTASPHHRSLDAMVRWSYDLCTPQEQRLWTRLAAFTGSPDLASIQAVCGFPPLEATELLDALDGLVAKSILLPEIRNGEMRYRLLETLREFALVHGRPSEDHDRARRAHVDHYRSWATRTAQSFFGPDQTESLERLASDFANLELAFEGSLGEPGRTREALQLASSLSVYWITGHLREGRRWLAQALQADTAPSVERGNALWVAAAVAALHGELPLAKEHLLAAGDIVRSTGDPRLTAHVATWSGQVALTSGDLPIARHAFETARVGHADLADPEGLLMTLFLRAFLKSAEGDQEGAAESCREAIDRSEDLGETWGRSYAVWVLAYDAWTRHDLAAAEEWAKQSLELKLAFRDDVGTALVINLMAGIALERGEATKAAQLLGGVEALWSRLDTRTAAFGPVLGSQYKAIESTVEEKLGHATFQRLYEEGRRLDPDGRTRLALDHITEPDKDRSEAAPAPDLLTAREKEVASYLADGLSNRAIAAALVISPRTAEVHVEHILAKLEVRSRAEAGMWAARTLGRSPHA